MKFSASRTWRGSFFEFACTRAHRYKPHHNTSYSYIKDRSYVYIYICICMYGCALTLFYSGLSKNMAVYEHMVPDWRSTKKMYILSPAFFKVNFELLAMVRPYDNNTTGCFLICLRLAGALWSTFCERLQPLYGSLSILNIWPLLKKSSSQVVGHNGNRKSLWHKRHMLEDTFLNG